MNVNTTWANHYKIGYNNEWFGARQNAEDRLDIQLDGCSRLPRGLNFEAVNAALIMTEKYGTENICLTYSGGQDSEIVLLSFIGSGRVPKKIVFLDYEGKNTYDAHFARSFCKHYGIPLEAIRVPAKEMLLSGESIEICARNNCAQVGLSFYLKAIEDLSKDYYVVTGDDPYIELINNPLTDEKAWFFFAREAFYSLFHIFHRLGHDGCPNFLQYTPELWLSFLDDPLMVNLRKQTRLTTSNQVKYDVYRHRFFTKPRYKSTGMEALKNLIYKANDDLLQKHPLLSLHELRYPFEKLHHELTRFIKDAYSTP